MINGNFYLQHTGQLYQFLIIILNILSMQTLLFLNLRGVAKKPVYEKVRQNDKKNEK